MPAINLQGSRLRKATLTNADGDEVDIRDDLLNTDISIFFGVEPVVETLWADTAQRHVAYAPPLGRITATGKPVYDDTNNKDRIMEATFQDSSAPRTFNFEFAPAKAADASTSGLHVNGTCVVGPPTYITNPETGASRIDNFRLLSSGQAWNIDNTIAAA